MTSRPIGMHHPLSPCRLEHKHFVMIRHWAPIILDGYAYYGRPQKPRRLILSHCSDALFLSGRARLTLQKPVVTWRILHSSLVSLLLLSSSSGYDATLMTSPMGFPVTIHTIFTIHAKTDPHLYLQLSHLFEKHC